MNPLCLDKDFELNRQIKPAALTLIKIIFFSPLPLSRYAFLAFTNVPQHSPPSALHFHIDRSFNTVKYLTFYPLRNVSLTFYEGKSEDGTDGGTLITSLSPAPLKSYG